MSAPDNSLDMQRSGLARTLLLAAAALWCVYWFVHAWPYWEDDAYIHLEFARSVAAHQGFAFNGRVVSGDTAPLWVLLLVAMHALIPDWLVAGKVLTALGVLLGLIGIYAFTRRLARALPNAPLVPAALVLLIVANPYFCYWAFSGMEPIAAAGVACFAVLAATSEIHSIRTFLAGCLLAGIAPLLRPEMVFLTAILVLLLLVRWFRLPGRGAARLATFAAGLLLLAAPLTAWSLYSLHAFGHFIPNTNAAKRAAPADSVVRHLLSIYALGFPLIVCGLLAGILYLLLRPAAVRRSIQSAIASAVNRTAAPQTSLPLAGWIFILWSLITTIFYIADHSYVQTRYILVTAPGLTVVIVLLALAASRRTGGIVYAAALLGSLALSLVTVRPFLRNKGTNCQATQEIALFIRDHTPSSAPVAAYAIGQIAFVSQHPIVDTGGITRPGAIPYLNAPPEAMLRWARSEGAQYAITDKPGPGAVLVFTADERFIGWTVHIDRYSKPIPVFLWKLPRLTAETQP
jgi:hypothetical protein